MHFATRSFAPSLLLVSVFLIVSKAHAAMIYYVSPSGNDANAGSQAFPKQHIQAAINSSASGNIIIVADGTYSGEGNRDLDFGGRNITLKSLSGATKTIIDCGGTVTTDGSGNHRGIYFHTGETENAVVNGFTINA